MQYYLTKHASDRAREMNLEPQVVADLILKPSVTRTCPSRREPGKSVYLLRSGALAAFADKDHNGDWKVITIVPATEEEWAARYPEQRGDRRVKPEVWKR
jgi:hypothetical protein